MVNIGDIFGYLTVTGLSVERANNGGKKYTLKCRCGNIVLVAAGDLLKVGVKNRSCGCYRTLNKLSTEQSSTEELEKRWRARHSGMLARCYKPNNKKYEDYGGRGITVQESLQNFSTYAKFMDTLWYEAGCPEIFLVDRRQVNENYTTDNIRLVNPAQSANNRRNTRYMVFNGTRMSITEVSEKTGIKRRTIRARQAAGWSDERIVSKPVEDMS